MKGIVGLFNIAMVMISTAILSEIIDMFQHPSLKLSGRTLDEVWLQYMYDV